MKTLKVSSRTEKYINRIKKYRILDPKESRELGILARSGDRKALNKLITGHLLLVVKFAYSMSNYVNKKGVTIEDLIQHGNIGLIKAAERYDPEQAKFSSYACWWIRSYIYTYVISNYSIIRSSFANDSRKIFFKYGKFVDEVLSINDPDEREKARIKFSKKYSIGINYIKSFEHRVGKFDNSFDKFLGDGKYGEETPHTLHDRIPSDVDIDEQINQKQTIEFVRRVVKYTSLNDREKFIVQERMISDSPVTLQAIGDKFCITRERARQIENQILNKLKSTALRIDGKSESN